MQGRAGLQLLWCCYWCPVVLDPVVCGMDDYGKTAAGENHLQKITVAGTGWNVG